MFFRLLINITGINKASLNLASSPNISSENSNLHANTLPPQMFAIYGIFQYVKSIVTHFVSVLVQQQPE